MKTRRSPHLLTATALAASLMLAACGGGSGEAPPAAPGGAADSTGPVVTITDSVADTTTSGEVTFTFNFNEDVGTSFTADDVTVTGGTKGVFTRVNGTRATLVVTPTNNAAGNIEVSVPANAALDGRGNGNAVASSLQAFNTLVPPTVGGTGTCTAATCTTFSGAGITFSPFENGGGGTVEIADDPNDATNKVVKFVKKPGDGDFFGTTIAGLAAPVTLSAASKTVTLRVLTPTAGTNFLLKFEGGAGGAVTEKDVVTTKANEWETLSFEMPGTGTFTTIVLFPNGRSSVAAQKTMYIDELKFPAAAAGGGGGGATTTTLASFDEATAPVFAGFDGAEGSSIAAGPAGGSGNALKILRAGGKEWAGAKVTVTPPAFSAAQKTITARVFSPAANIPIVLKMEGAGIASAEIQAAETVVAGWQTLTWVVTGIDITKSYPDIVFLPNLGTVAPASGETYYIDDIKFSGAPAGGGGGSTGALMASFDEAPALVFAGFDGAEGSSIDAAPPAGGGAGKALKILRAGGKEWAGAKVTTAAPVFTATDKTISAKVYSPLAGIPIVLKMEGTGIASAEIQATEQVVVGWQTLTWVVTGIDTAKRYPDVVFLPHLGTVGPAAGESFYVDDIRFSGALAAAAGGGGGGGGGPSVEMGAGGPQTLTVATGDVKTGDGGNTMFVAGEGLFAVNFVGSAETMAPFNLAAYPGAKTANFASLTGISGGDIGFFQDDANLSTSSQKVDELGWITGTSYAPNGVPNFFRTFVLKGPVSNSAYMGLFMNAPNNGTVNVSSFGKLKIKVWGPGPMFERANLNPVLEITLVGPKVAGCTTGSGGSEITQNLTANQKNGAGGFYTLPLSGFTVKGLCGTDSSAANVLAKLARVVVTVPGTSFNYTNLDGGNYATGVNLGPVGFTNN